MITALIVISCAKGKAATILDICSTCTYTTIGAAEAAAINGDILEFRASETFNEKWVPGGERTIRVQPATSFNVTFGKNSGGGKGAVDLSSAGANPVSILGREGVQSSLTLRVSGVNDILIEHSSGSNALDFVWKWATATLEGGGEACLVATDGTSGRTYEMEAILFNGQSETNSDGINYTTDATGLMTVTNCTFINMTALGISITGSQTGITTKLVNNTFGNVATAVTADDPVSMINNVFSNDVTDDIALTSPAVVGDFIFNNFEEESIIGMPASNTDATVTFINAAAGDYRLAVASPAIDAGTTSDTVVDFENESRPQGPSYDQGMDEVLSMGDGPKPGSRSLKGYGR